MPHNMPMLYLSEGGIVEAAGYSLFVLFFFVSVYKAARATSNKTLAAMVMLSYLTFFFTDL